jgi:hypothetical protein
MVETGLPPLLLRGAMQWGRHACRMGHSYALRRKSEARTLSRNGIGGSGGVAGGFTAFFAALRADCRDLFCVMAQSSGTRSRVLPPATARKAVGCNAPDPGEALRAAGSDAMACEVRTSGSAQQRPGALQSQLRGDCASQADQRPPPPQSERRFADGVEAARTLSI